MEGKFFFIKSRLNGLVLDCEGGHADPGTHVITYHQKDYDDADNQLWFEDHHHGVIRSKENPALCLTINHDNDLIVDHVDHDNHHQKWNPVDDFIQSRTDGGKCLDIAGKNSHSGARICAWDYNGQENQKWDFDHPKGLLFYIKSKMNGKVLDVRGANPEPGAEVVMYEQGDEPDNQLWLEDRKGIIRSKLNGFALDSSGDEIRMHPYEHGNHEQEWVIHDEDRVVKKSDHHKCLDIKGKSDHNGASLCEYKWKGSDNQKWEIIHI